MSALPLRGRREGEVLPGVAARGRRPPPRRARCRGQGGQRGGIEWGRGSAGPAVPLLPLPAGCRPRSGSPGPPRRFGRSPVPGVSGAAPGGRSAPGSDRVSSGSERAAKHVIGKIMCYCATSSVLIFTFLSLNHCGRVWLGFFR